MPNKYSHAIVLSNYGSHGLINFDSSRPSKPTFSASSSRASARSKAQHSPSTQQSSQCDPAQRLRLGSPTRPKSKPGPPPLHRKTSSVETQIYAPLHSPTPPPTRDAQSFEPTGHESEYKASSHPILEQNPSSKTQSYTPGGRHVPYGSPAPPLTQGHKEATHLQPQEPTLQRPLPSGLGIERYNNSSTEIQYSAPRHLPHVEQHPNRRHSSAVAIGRQSYSSSDTIRASSVRRENDSHVLKGLEQPRRIPHNRYGRMPFAAQPFAPERPPSPPATPDSEKSFSLKTPMEKPDPITSPPPIPERSARRTPPGPSRTSNSPTSPMSNVEPEPSRPMTSPALSSPKLSTGTTFSITSRTSSLKAATTPPSDPRVFSMTSEPFFDDDSRLDPFPRTFDIPFAVDDEDLESLPSTYVPSSPDFSIEPWSDDNAGPAIFRDSELNSLRPLTTGSASTRASSFDSAAPPPIAMNGRIPSRPTETVSSNTPEMPKSHKKSKPSLASLAFFRSAPKAVLYSQTRAATPPVPVSVSRNAVPSIPALFPGYKGAFPPSERHGERISWASREANKPKQLRDRSSSRRASERRRSWLRATPLKVCQQTNEEKREYIEDR